jgi:predicted nuclease of restriction endonuclease-like RecB superfamily
VLRGLIKLLADRCEFATASVAEPFEIRQQLFLEAGKSHPVLPDSNHREKVLKTLAETLQTDADEILAGVYADLSAQQKLIAFDSLEPRELLDRYNLAQAQALLYKCVELRIRVAPSDAENYRSIFGWIKHFGLIHTISGDAANGYDITLTGAASLFHRSQKYGVQMSVFLPALLLCRNWRMSAEIAQKNAPVVFYELSSNQTELNSHYFNDHEYKNSDVEKLKIDWEKFKTTWQLRENREVINLGKTAFIPDFVLISPDEDIIYLDVLGFWTPKALRKRLDEFQSANFRKFIFIVCQELRGTREEPLWESENVLFYKTKILPRSLEETAKRLV